MNSSVTFDSATSVMSSLCLAIRLSSRSNGTLEVVEAHLEGRRLGSRRVGGGRPMVVIPRCSRRTSALSSPFASKSASASAIASRTSRPRSTASPWRAAQRQPGVLDVEQLVGGDVDRHLLVVPDPSARPRFVGRRGLGLGVRGVGDARRTFGGVGPSAGAGGTGRRRPAGSPVEAPEPPPPWPAGGRRRRRPSSRRTT